MNRQRTGKRRKRVSFRIRNLLLPIIILYIFSLIIAGFNINNIKAAVIESEASSIFQKAAGESLKESLEYLKGTEKSDGGYLLDGYNLSLLKVKITEKLNKSLSKTSLTFIPSGNFTGVYLLEGIGFPIPVRISFVGKAEVSFKESFESRGVNQSLYVLKLVINGNMNTVSMKYKGESLPFSTEYILAERIIVGEVPDYFSGG